MTYTDALKDYIEVKDRIQEFYAKYDQGSLQFEFNGTMEVAGQTIIWGRAYAYRDQNDLRPGIGTAWELVPGKSQFTRGSELMVLETSAWGRAIAALGIAVNKSVASRNEVQAAQSRDPWAGPPIEAVEPDLSALGARVISNYQETPKEAQKTYTGPIGVKPASVKQINFLKSVFGKAWNACGYASEPNDGDVLTFINYNTDEVYTDLTQVTSLVVSKLLDNQSNYVELIRQSKNDVAQWKDQAF